MPDAPPAVRGQAYTTHLFQKCYNYHQCKRCLMCNAFNPYDSMCVSCEGYKPPGMNSCKARGCTDDQQAGIVLLEQIFGRPLHNQNAEASTVEVLETSFNQNNQLLVDEF